MPGKDKKGERNNEKKLLRVMQVANFKKQEKSFVIAIILMGIFNFSIIIFMLNS